MESIVANTPALRFNRAMPDLTSAADPSLSDRIAQAFPSLPPQLPQQARILRPPLKQRQ